MQGVTSDNKNWVANDKKDKTIVFACMKYAASEAPSNRMILVIETDSSDLICLYGVVRCLRSAI